MTLCPFTGWSDARSAVRCAASCDRNVAEKGVLSLKPGVFASSVQGWRGALRHVSQAGVCAFQSRAPGGRRGLSPVAGLGLGLCLCLELVPSAFAAGPPDITPQTRGTAAREIDQPSPGHSSVGLGVTYLRSSTLFGADGLPVAGNHQYLRTDTTLTLDIRYGISELTAFRFALPVSYPTLETDESGGLLSNAIPMPGDALVALKRKLTSRVRSPLYGTSLELLARLPSGHTSVSAPGAALTTGTGVGEVELGALWHKSAGNLLAVDIQARFTQPLTDVVAYTLEVPTGGDGRIFPGYRALGALNLTLQPTTLLSLGIAGKATWHGPYYYGDTGENGWPARADEPIANSSGLFVEAGGQVGLHLAAAPISFLLDVHYLLMGRTLDAFSVLALDRFSPPPGLSGGLSGWLRF